jgi:hypothetical protein
MAVAAAWLWWRRPHGYLIVGAGLVMWVIECACVAVDQWYGHAANPASTVYVDRARSRVRGTCPDRNRSPLYYLLRDFGVPMTAA